MEPLEKRIKKVRKSAGFTQPQLAELIGVSIRTIKNYEKDASSVAVSIVQKIAFICKVNEIWLLTGQGRMLEDSNNLTRVIIEHQDIVKQFKDPERAKNINKRLLEIEDISEDIYNKVDGYIEASCDAARVIKGSLKKISENG